MLEEFIMLISVAQAAVWMGVWRSQRENVKREHRGLICHISSQSSTIPGPPEAAQSGQRNH